MWLLHSCCVIASTNKIFIIANGQLVYSILHREHRTVLASLDALLGAANSLAGQDLSVPYVCDVNRNYAATWFRSIATQLIHCLAGSFSFSVSVSLLVHLSIPRIIATSWSVESVTPAQRARVRIQSMMTSMKPLQS